MSRKIVGWLSRAWADKFSDLTKNLKERKKYSEINLKKGNPTFLPTNTWYLNGDKSQMVTKLKL